jgi:3',5'-cyclic AMP phosphodiesterase CpdA
MRTIVHLSDLHFGRHDPELVRPLIDAVRAHEPHLVVVSGDLTERARPGEFAQARAFLDELRFPQVVVPGNHDVPLYRVVERFGRPLAHYQRFIGDPSFPAFHDHELAVIGVNSSRSLTVKNGRISYAQVRELEARLHAVGAQRFCALVTHHPFIAPPTALHLPRIGRAAHALETLESTGVQVLLAGHLHRAFTGDVLGHYPALRRSILVMQAGTALSTRLRGERNAFNVVKVAPPHVSCTTYAHDGASFHSCAHIDYERRDRRWYIA